MNDTRPGSGTKERTDDADNIRHTHGAAQADGSDTQTGIGDLHRGM
ncbi:MAG TPA: hypothetical protein VGN32_05200 [Ktedonobacterales bacterium]|jgi:hypothetical protein|nr:hypothetical protein [Ktedonobacterales bacterium]